MSCLDCHQPTGRGPRARLCRPCARERRRASMYRYTQKPSTKLARAAYADANREAIRGYKRKYRAKSHVAGTIRPCATLLCPNSFVLIRKSGPRKFCATCQETFYGPAYRNRQRAA